MLKPFAHTLPLPLGKFGNILRRMGIGCLRLCTIAHYCQWHDCGTEPKDMHRRRGTGKGCGSRIAFPFLYYILPWLKCCLPVVSFFSFRLG